MNENPLLCDIFDCNRTPIKLKLEPERTLSVGYGTKSETSAASMQHAIDAGFTFIDAKDTNKSLHSIKKLLFERDKIQFCSKLMGESKPDNHNPQNVRAECLNSLQTAGLSYWDVYYIHTAHAFADIPILDTWEAMIELKVSGLARSIGLSNITLDQLTGIVLNSDAPDYVQIEMHPYLTENAILEFCLSRNIRVVAHSPFGSVHNKGLLQDPVLLKLAQKYGRTPPQLILKWHLQRGVTPIPSSNNPTNIIANRQANFELEEADLIAITALNKDKRGYVKPNHNEYRLQPTAPYPRRVTLPAREMDTPIVQDLYSKGYHVCALSQTNVELYQLCVKISKHVRNLSHEKRKKIYNRSFMTEADDVGSKNYKQQVAIDPFLNRIAKSYLDAAYSTNIFISQNTPSRDMLPHQSGLYHRDSQKQKTLKVVIYLNDVDEWNGPVKLVLRDHEQTRWFLEKNHGPVPRTTESELLRTGSTIETAVGPACTAIFFEGSLTHCGGFVQRGVRHAVYLEFLT